MKSLHKKIGAMVLAGMVVLGGVAVSGVNSFAASKEVVVKNAKQDPNYQKVEFFSKGYGEIIEVSNKASEIKKIIKEKYNIKKACSMGRSIPIKIPSQVSVKLFEGKCAKKELINISYNGMNYLIKIK